MAYLNCWHCGLEIKIQGDDLRIENCPRCVARNATVAPMTLSSGGVTHAVGWGSHPSEHLDGESGERFVGAAARRSGRPR